MSESMNMSTVEVLDAVPTLFCARNCCFFHVPQKEKPAVSGFSISLIP